MLETPQIPQHSARSHPQRPIQLAMMIDDEPVDQMVFQRAVKRSGLVDEFVSFSGAEAALEYLANPENPAVDVVFLDVNMPRMNGLEFLEAATQKLGPNFARSCVVMLTTALSATTRAQAEGFEVVREFVDKPIRPDHLQDVAVMLAEETAGPWTH